MKKVLIKILTLVLTFTSLLAVSLFAGCDCAGGLGGNVIPKPEEEIVRVLTLDSTNLNVIVGDEHKFVANYKKEEGKSLTFTSSDTSVAEVNDMGKLVANNEGTAKITATYGDLTAECSVTVSFGNYLPELSFEGGLLDEYNIGLDGKAYEFVPVIKFNGKLFYDVEATFVSSDEEVVKFNNAEVTGVKLGSATATVTASWRGFTIDKVPGLQKVINLKTNNVVNFLINGEAPKTIEISTFNSKFAGQEYSNWADFKPSIMLNGKLVDNAITNIEVENPEILTYADNKITSKERGKTKINLTYYDSSSNKYTASINIEIIRPIADSGKKFNLFSSKTGYYKDVYNDFKNVSVIEKLFGSRVHLVTDAYVVGTNEQLTVEGDKILNVPISNDGSVLNEIVIGTKTYAYSCKLDTYSVVVADKEDLELFDVHYLDAEKTQISYTDGYCELVRDIDATGFKTSHTAVQPSNPTHNFTAITNAHGIAQKAGFRGVFNGNGHTIFNLDTTRNVVYNNSKGNNETSTRGVGLFGFLQGNYVIKNVAFENMKVDKGNGLAYTATSHVANTAIVKKGSGTYENIYISLSEDSRSPQGLLFTNCFGGRFILNNILINAPHLTYESNYATSSGLIDINGDVNVLFHSYAKYNGVVIISKHPVGMKTSYQTYGENEKVIVDGKDVTDKIALDVKNETYPEHRRKSGIKKFNSTKEMSEAVGEDINLSTFNNSYWQIEEKDGSKVLQWKALMGYTFDFYDENEETFDSILFDKKGSSKSFTIRNSIETITNYTATVSDSNVLEVKAGKINLKEYKLGYYEITFKFINSFGNEITRVIPVTVDALNVNAYLSYDKDNGVEHTAWDDNGEIVGHGLQEDIILLPDENYRYMIDNVEVTGTVTGSKILLDNLSSANLPDKLPGSVTVKVIDENDEAKMVFNLTYVTLAIDEAEDLTKLNVGYTYDDAVFTALNDNEKVAYLENAQNNPYDYYDGYYVLVNDINANGITFTHEAVLHVNNDHANVGFTINEEEDKLEVTEGNSTAPIVYNEVTYNIPRINYPAYKEVYIAKATIARLPGAYFFKMGLLGTFDGQGYTISNLNAIRPAQKYYVDNSNSTTGNAQSYDAGIFGAVNAGSVIKNVAVTDVVFGGKYKNTGGNRYTSVFAMLDISPADNETYTSLDVIKGTGDNRTRFENIYIKATTSVNIRGGLYTYSVGAFKYTVSKKTYYCGRGAYFENVFMDLTALTSAWPYSDHKLSVIMGGTVNYDVVRNTGGTSGKPILTNVYVAYSGTTFGALTYTGYGNLDITIAPTLEELYTKTQGFEYKGNKFITTDLMSEAFANMQYWTVDGNAVYWKGLEPQA